MDSSENNITTPTAIPTKTFVSPKDFDSIYSLSEDKMLEAIINNELSKFSVDDIKLSVPEYIKRRKEIMSYLLSILIFVFVSSIFFHFSIKFYVYGGLILLGYIIFYAIFTKFSFMNYIIKKLKENPKDKISNVVTQAKNEVTSRYNNLQLLLYILFPIIAAVLIFLKPRIFYEWADDGYAVRLYSFGVLNYKTAEIPETYNGKKVVSLRGNAFSDMFFLESVKLPDSIKEIRGQAFKNCINLKDVNLPKNLEYLGGSAFANTFSLESIELPDSLTYLGGSAFYGAYFLENIRLSNNLTEIRGNTFENCTSLKSITIPDGVKRIGGHAFDGASELSEVIIGENSQLEEIGGGAFAKAISLKSIELPDTVTHLGGEAFYGDSSLESIRLSNNLTEIRGNTFENCTSLKSITIPDGVKRIGGHAFYGANKLSEVIIGENSQLEEIGSSAFRQCRSLSSITIPFTTFVNERAFKEGPTSVHRFPSK